jgi:Ca2+-binding RTX toxin-like protein
MQKSRKNFVLTVESLERRELLIASATMAGTTLQIRGSEGADQVTVRQINDHISVDGATIVINGQQNASILASKVALIWISTSGGADAINLNSAAIVGQQPITIATALYGGDGPDQISGGDGKDFINGGTDDGDDVLYGGKGDDALLGGPGNDKLYGNSGNDSLQAGTGSYADFMYGGEDNDTLTGDPTFRSYMYGENGDDVLSGGDWYGGDEMLGGDGNDRLIGNGGNDYIDAGTGRFSDFLYGGDGNDTMISNTTFTTVMFGGNDDDEMRGGDGDDRLYGDIGNDTIYGNGGKDYIEAGTLSFADYIYGGDGDDTLKGDPNFRTRMHGGAGDDKLYGGDWYGGDEMYGDEGNDYLYGNGGNDYLEAGTLSYADYLYGGEGDDLLIGDPTFRTRMWGGKGDDELRGGNWYGGDEMYGEEGNDKLYGNGGDDYLDAGTGSYADYLYGGDNNDILVGDPTFRTRMWGENGDDELRGGNWYGGDEMYGGDGNDRLYGNGGTDYLDGGKGNDGIVGGTGKDTVSGGPGADRYLCLDDSQPDAIATGALESQDARLHFRNGNATWTDEEMTKVDVGLNWLHQKTNNTRMLKYTYTSAFTNSPLVWELEFERIHTLDADPGTVTLADNGRGHIRVADATFGKSDPESVIVHEIGHDFQQIQTNSTIKDFNAISGWTVVVDGFAPVPSGYTRGQTLTGAPTNYAYRNGTQFARDYGKKNPYEDFATCIEVYYSREKAANLWQAKWNYVDSFFKRLKT